MKEENVFLFSEKKKKIGNRFFQTPVLLNRPLLSFYKKLKAKDLQLWCRKLSCKPEIEKKDDWRVLVSLE